MAEFIDGHKEFAKVVLTDGTVLTDVTSTRFTGYDQTVWFLGADDKGHWVYAPTHQVVRLHI